MKEEEWLLRSNIYCMIDYLVDRDEYARRLRLFAGACCRQVWELLLPAAKKIVELSDGYADGKVTVMQLQQAEAIENGFGEHQHQERPSALVLNANRAARGMGCPALNVDAVVQATSGDPCTDFFYGSEEDGPGRGVLTSATKISEKLKLLLDIFGNPFRPVTFNPAWRTEHTVGIAAKMYDERDFVDMPILADALEDAGCDNEDVLSHCRGEGPHVRGCWVVDLVLGKE